MVQLLGKEDFGISIKTSHNRKITPTEFLLSAYDEDLETNIKFWVTRKDLEAMRQHIDTLLATKPK